MPNIPQRKLSKGEILNKRRHRKFAARMHKQADYHRGYVNRIVEERYQSRLAHRLITLIPFDTEL